MGKFFFRYTTASYNNQNINGSISIPYGVGVFNEKTESWMISHTKEIGLSVINNFRFGRLEPIAIQGGTSHNERRRFSALGLSGVYPEFAGLRAAVPDSQPSERHPNSLGSQGNDTTTSDIPTWQFSDSFTLIKGRHTISVGFDYRRWMQSANFRPIFSETSITTTTLFLNNSGGCTTARELRNRQCGRRLPSGLLQRRDNLPTRAFSPQRGGQSESIPLHVFCTVRSGRLESDQPPDSEPGSALGLPFSAHRKAQQNVLVRSPNPAAGCALRIKRWVPRHLEPWRTNSASW